MHLLSLKKLRIKDSTIANAGKGLFAKESLRSANMGGRRRQPLYKANDLIVEYSGEPIPYEQVQERYGTYTAPYATKVRGALCEDAACQRGVGAMINHSGNSRKVNARLAYSNSNNNPKGVVRALKNIYDGDELFVNYGNQYRFNEQTTHRTKKR
jgi:SET domain-containing protein